MENMQMRVDLEMLDKLEALAQASLQAPTAIKAEQALSDFHDEANPAMVRKLIALARRSLTSGAPAVAQVGCERPDGLLNIHSEAETCEVCEAGAAAKTEQVRCPHCGTHEIELSRTCHNSACSAYAESESVYKGWDRATAAGAGSAQPRAEGDKRALPERDASKPAWQQGLFRKFDVRRVDGSDQKGGKHYGCRYYVLDLTHDQHAPAAMRAYAVACRSTHPRLADDIEAEFGRETFPTRLQELHDIIEPYAHSIIKRGFSKEEQEKRLEAVAAYIESLFDRAAHPVQDGEKDAARLYTCIGKGGEYELIGTAKGAGTVSKLDDMRVYRGSNGRLYYRTCDDFDARMQRLDRAAMAAAQQDAKGEQP